MSIHRPRDVPDAKNWIVTEITMEGRDDPVSNHLSNLSNSTPIYSVANTESFRGFNERLLSNCHGFVYSCQIEIISSRPSWTATLQGAKVIASSRTPRHKCVSPFLRGSFQGKVGVTYPKDNWWEAPATFVDFSLELRVLLGAHCLPTQQGLPYYC
jgi:hypothetical protein